MGLSETGDTAILLFIFNTISFYVTHKIERVLATITMYNIENLRDRKRDREKEINTQEEIGRDRPKGKRRGDRKWTRCEFIALKAALSQTVMIRIRRCMHMSTHTHTERKNRYFFGKINR